MGEGGDEFYVAQSGRCVSLLVNAGEDYRTLLALGLYTVVLGVLNVP